MGNVDTTKREVEAHEAKGNPHADSASTSDLNNHEQKGNPHPDSASLSDLHDRPSAGTHLSEDANGNFNVTLSQSVEAVEDGDSVSNYSNSNGGYGGNATVCNISGSGVLVGGVVESDLSNNTGGPCATITVDGMSFSINGVTADTSTPGTASIPVVRFDSGLKVVAETPTSGYCAGTVTVIQ